MNVCIARLPRGESVVRPASHCPHCKAPIAWHDNIPLASFLALGARCRHCREKISWRYFFVELVSGGLWLFFWNRFGFSWPFAAGVLLGSILLAVSMTDFETGFIPDALTLPGIAAGLVLSALDPAMHHEVFWYRGFMQSGVGLAAGGAILLATGWLGNLIFRKESMGGGDVKLLAMIGAFLGAKETVWVFFLSPVVALPFALYMKFFRKAETIPYGPFLALTGAGFFIYGDWITKMITLMGAANA